MRLKFTGFTLFAGLVLLGCQGHSPSNPPVTLPEAPGIIGGFPVSEGHWMGLSSVYIFVSDPNDSGKSTMCSGTLIAYNKVLTAGHCADPSYVSKVVFAANARAAALKLQRGKKASGAVDVVSSVVHDDYNPAICEHKLYPCVDLGILTLEKNAPAPYRPMPLINDTTALEVGVQLVIQGYGTVRGVLKSEKDDGEVGLLRTTAVRIKGFEDEKKYIVVDQSQGTGFCRGDSGGGAVVIDKDKQVSYLVGVTSRVMYNVDETPQAPDLLLTSDGDDGTDLSSEDPCAEQGVVVSVTPFLPWIQEHVQPSPEK